MNEGDLRRIHDRLEDLESLYKNLARQHARVSAIAHQLDALVRSIDSDPFIEYGDKGMLPYSVSDKLEAYVATVPTSTPSPDETSIRG